MHHQPERRPYDPVRGRLQLIRTRLVGDAAKRQAVTNSSRTVFAVKRLMGRMANSPEVEHWKQHAPYKIVAGANGAAVVEIDGHQYTRRKSPRLSSAS